MVGIYGRHGPALAVIGSELPKFDVIGWKIRSCFTVRWIVYLRWGYCDTSGMIDHISLTRVRTQKEVSKMCFATHWASQETYSNFHTTIYLNRTWIHAIKGCGTCYATFTTDAEWTIWGSGHFFAITKHATMSTSQIRSAHMSVLKTPGWWFGTWLLFFPSYRECHHPN